MKLNKDGVNNLIIIIACIVAVVMIMAEVSPLYIFGILGVYAMYMGIQTIYYKEIPRRKDYKDIKNKNKFCIHTAVWMIFMGVGMIGLCIALVFGLDEVYFWGGILLCIVLAIFYNNVVRRMFVNGYRSNLEKLIDLLKPSRKR